MRQRLSRQRVQPAGTGGAGELTCRMSREVKFKVGLRRGPGRGHHVRIVDFTGKAHISTRKRAWSSYSEMCSPVVMSHIIVCSEHTKQPLWTY